MSLKKLPLKHQITYKSKKILRKIFLYIFVTVTLVVQLSMKSLR